MWENAANAVTTTYRYMTTEKKTEISEM